MHLRKIVIVSCFCLGYAYKDISQNIFLFVKILLLTLYVFTYCDYAYKDIWLNILFVLLLTFKCIYIVL